MRMPFKREENAGAQFDIKKIYGGVLVQDKDSGQLLNEKIKCRSFFGFASDTNFTTHEMS